MKTLLIKDARVFTGDRTFSSSDILLSGTEGRYCIEKICPSSDDMLASDNIYKAGGLFVLPAFVDICPVFCEPGFVYREDISSMTRSASAGGFCAVLGLPRTDPPCDTVEAVATVNKAIAEKAVCLMKPAGRLALSEKNELLTDIPAMADAGVKVFSEGFEPVFGREMKLEAMKKCAEHDAVYISYPQYPSSACGKVNEGRISGMLKLPGIPTYHEEISVAEDIILAEKSGCHLHLMNISTAGSVEILRFAKSKGVNVTASTAPEYFSLTEEDILFHGINAFLYPPLRTSADREAVCSALADGTIDCISCDHRPLRAKEKDPDGSLLNAGFGSLGLQTAFSASLTYLFAKKKLSLETIINALSFNPAAIYGIDVSVREGNNANLCVADINEEYAVTNNMFLSRSGSSSFEGLVLQGTVKKCFLSYLL